MERDAVQRPPRNTAPSTETGSELSWRDGPMANWADETLQASCTWAKNPAGN